MAAALGEGGLFLADRDGEVMATDLGGYARAAALLAHRPCAVFGCWRAGGLLTRPAADLPPLLQAERAADAALFGREHDALDPVTEAQRQALAARQQAQVAAAIAERGAPEAWVWCAYRERGCPLAVEPAVIVAGRIDLAWLVRVAGGCNQQHVGWVGPDDVMRPHVAERGDDGRIVGYRPVAGSPPRLRLLVHRQLA